MTKEEIFELNIKLAYKMAWKYKNCGIEFEELKQICCMGLWKAILTYKCEKGALSTYSYLVIRNEVNLFLRRIKKDKNTISIETKIKDNITILDTLCEIESCIDRVHDKIEIKELKVTALQAFKGLKDREKIVYKLMIKGKKQKDIAKLLGITQTQVSRLETKIKQRLVKLYEIGGKINANKI